MSHSPEPTARPEILVLGGTGLVGREVLAALRRRGADARVLVRDPDRLVEAGVDVDGLDVRIGDLRDPASLRAAVDGVRAVFTISPHEADETALARTVVGVCEDAGARLVFAGVHVGGRTAAQAWVMRRVYGRLLPRYRGKIAIAHLVERSRTDPVILAPSNFMQNDEVLLAVIRSGEFVQPAHPKGLNRVDLRDVGEAAATVLLDPAFPSGSYPVVGPRSLTGPECAAEWSRALGRPVRYTGDDDRALERALRAHVPGHRGEDWLASMRLLRGFRVRTDAADVATTARLLGRAPTDFADHVRRVVAERGLAPSASEADAR